MTVTQLAAKTMELETLHVRQDGAALFAAAPTYRTGDPLRMRRREPHADRTPEVV